MAEGEATPRCAFRGRAIPVGGRVCEVCRPWANGPPDAPASEEAPPTSQLTPINHFWVALLLISFISAVVYRYIHQRQLVESWAMFMGLPLIIGVLSAYLIRPRGSFGTAMKVTTILICVVAPIMGEFLVCMLMAAPIFYAVAALGYLLAVGLDRLFNGPGGRGGMACLLLLPFVAAEVTAGRGGIRNGETNVVSDVTFIAAPPDRAWEALRRGDLISSDVPLFLRLGFPRPTRLERLPEGETRLTFDSSWAPWEGTNVIVSRRRVEARRRRLTFFILEDGTRLSRWVTFMQTRFEVTPVAGGGRSAAGCHVRQTTTFQRRLQPGVYWRPLQGFAVGQMHAMALSRVRQLAEARR